MKSIPINICQILVCSLNCSSELIQIALFVLAASQFAQYQLNEEDEHLEGEDEDEAIHNLQTVNDETIFSCSILSS